MVKLANLNDPELLKQFVEIIEDGAYTIDTATFRSNSGEAFRSDLFADDPKDTSSLDWVDLFSGLRKK